MCSSGSTIAYTEVPKLARLGYCNSTVTALHVLARGNRPNCGQNGTCTYVNMNLGPT